MLFSLACKSYSHQTLCFTLELLMTCDLSFMGPVQMKGLSADTSTSVTSVLSCVESDINCSSHVRGRNITAKSPPVDTSTITRCILHNPTTSSWLTACSHGCIKRSGHSDGGRAPFILTEAGHWCMRPKRSFTYACALWGSDFSFADLKMI